MTPDKPFSRYAWRWLMLTPSEGLLKAPIFFGVLRILSRHQGKPFTSHDFYDELVQADIDLVDVRRSRSRPLTLARSRDRNVVRNSGQYWRGTGMLTSDRGIIHLTEVGRRVASGAITEGEFAALMVRETILPNPYTYSVAEIADWQNAGLEIRPLYLILQVISQLGYRHGKAGAWLNNDELTKVVIPLAGVRAEADDIARYVARYRLGTLNIAGWPDCVPGANDKRLAREFLLFLANFDLLRLDLSEPSNAKQRFYMDELYDLDAPVDGTASIFAEDTNADDIIDEVRHSSLPSIVERQRTLAATFARPGQSRFRAKVMEASGGRCFLTGESIAEVLEAAHIVPVKHKGADECDNGFCMRVDIHRLYDAGHLRIRPDGTLMLSEAVAGSANYASLPKVVTFPNFIKPANVAWRDTYL